MRYSISKFRDFFGIFLNFLGTFSYFEYIYKKYPSNFLSRNL